MTNASKFWANIRKLEPIFETSIIYELGSGESIQFWFDDWFQGQLSNKFKVVFRQVRYTDISVEQWFAGQDSNLIMVQGEMQEGQQELA
jgi:hypothetical protein